MAISNKFGGMVVTTGNKSEMSVGYATLYGDMNGGFNPIKDLYKMEVYRLARWRNAHVPKGGGDRRGDVIPEDIITKVPTAELRPNQTDQDSLPPYRGARRHPRMPRREGDAARRDRRARASGGDGEEGRAAALSRRVQAAAGAAGVKISAQQLRARSALPDRQPVPRGAARRDARYWQVCGNLRKSGRGQALFDLTSAAPLGGGRGCPSRSCISCAFFLRSPPERCAQSSMC